MTRPLISPEELKAALGHDIAIIDTRNPDDYAEKHIPGSVNMHEIFTFLATSTQEGMQELADKFSTAFGAAGLDGKKMAVVYEQSMDSGFGQSCRGYFLLDYLGYPSIRVLHGGLKAWEAKGYPVTRDQPKIEPVEYQASANAAKTMLTKDDVKSALGRSDIALLDVRDVDEWIGDSSSPYGKDFCPRKGRIPGAKWIEWYRMMKPTETGPMIKSPDEILAECASVGIAKETPVYIYCFKGARAANTFVALKEAELKDVRIYFGSWNEWSRDFDLPIDEGLPFRV